MMERRRDIEYVVTHHYPRSEGDLSWALVGFISGMMSRLSKTSVATTKLTHCSRCHEYIQQPSARLLPTYKKEETRFSLYRGTSATDSETIFLFRCLR